MIGSVMRQGMLAALILAMCTLTASTNIAGAQQMPPTAPHWHAPTDHEHGDEDPAWSIKMFLDNPQLQQYFGADSSGHLAYDIPFNTGPVENGIVDGKSKHWAMKGIHLNYSADRATGFHGKDGSWLDGYARFHLSATAVDREAAFHSYAIVIAGFDDLLTIRQGWMYTGTPPDDNSRVPDYCSLTGSNDAALKAACSGYNAFQRPIVFVVTPDSLKGTYTSGRPTYSEQWYVTMPGFNAGWAISDATTMIQAGEKVTDYDWSKWGVVRGANGQQNVGLLRRIELQGGKGTRTGLFWTNQHGSVVDDPSGPECQGLMICLLQYVNPKYQGIDGRSELIDFPGRGQVKVPN